MPESFELPPEPYRFGGLTVRGVSPTRLTAVPNPLIHDVSAQMKRDIARRNLARRFTESRLAIVTAGLGVHAVAPTVSAHVRAMTITAGLVRVAANIRQRERLSSTPTPAPRSEVEIDLDDVEVELE